MALTASSPACDGRVVTAPYELSRVFGETSEKQEGRTQKFTWFSGAFFCFRFLTCDFSLLTFFREGWTRGRLTLLLPVMRGPGRIAEAVALVPRRPLEQCLDRIRPFVHRRRADRQPSRTAPASSPA